MKKLVERIVMLLLVLGMSVNAAWAEDDGTIYYASLKAQKDPSSTGSGNVKLTWLDITGRPMEVNLAKQLNWAANSDIDWNNSSQAMQGLMYMGSVEDWNEIEGAETYSGPAPTAQVLGGTMVAMEGMETPVEMGTGSQIYMTSFVYFHAEAEPADGSYLAEWQIVGDENQYVTRMTSSMSPADPMGELVYKEEWSAEEDAWVNVIDEEKSIPLRTPCFKVLPSAENSALFPGDNSDPQYAVKMAGALAAAQSVKKNSYNNIYAVFNKYLLGNSVATSAGLEAVENEQAHLTVTVEVNGDTASLDEADFADFTFTNNGSDEWSYDLAAALASREQVSAQKTRIVIPVTYTYKNTGAGAKNTTMTISMAGDNPSVLNVNLSVGALDPARPEAFWMDGKDDESPVSGALAEILAMDISAYANPILKLNKPVNIDLNFSGKNFTLDLNGNVAQAITVSSGNVTVAYSKFGGSATSLTVNGGTTTLEGGTFGSLIIGSNGTVEQNGATISDDATNNGTLITTEGIINGGLTSYGTLIIEGGTFNGTNAVEVAGGTADVKKGTLNGASCGLLVSGGTVTTQKLAAITSDGSYSAQQTGGTLNVVSGKFGKPLYGSINFTAGFFKNVGDTVGLSAGKTGMLVSAGVEYNEGYRYFLGTSESALANGVGVCRIGTTSYTKLEDAIAYANNNPSVENIVIFMTNNYTLPAGYYTLPANATIVVPMSDTQEKEINLTAPRIVFNDQRTETPYVSIQPSEFRRLTFAKGVNMDVFGDIELTCSQYASNEAYTSQPVGSYGRLVMEDGSHMTLQDGSELRAWGFMTGKGETDARRGAKVREMFQMGDWKGAMTSVRITGMVKQDEVSEALWNQVKSDDSGYKIFPVTQYFIQNVESPVKYHPGSLLSTSAAVSEGLMGMSVSMAATDIGIVGVSRSNTDRDVAIFLMDENADAENTWVRKWYDVENDIQVYDINSAAHIGSMLLDMGDINLLTYGTVPIRLNSAKFDLPLTCNFKIHLLSGTMDFQQNTCLLPGAEVEVDKEATVTVAMEEEEKEAYDAWVEGGKVGDAPVSYTGAVYVYDADQWGKYAYCNEYDGLNMQSSTAYTKVVRYSPSWKGRPNKRAEQTKPADAAINVHGTFATATGFVYTSASGANIFSSNEDAGTFIFNDDAVNAGTRTVYNVKGVKTYESLTFYPARLKNGIADPQYVNTDEAIADLAYCYQNDKWSTMIQDGCFMKENRGGVDIYYAKPQEYVAVVATKVTYNKDTEDEYKVIEGNADHTYSDADGAGRLFILMPDACQWWEVEKKDNLYHCIHPNNDTYYYWDEDEYAWIEKRYTITWKNWNGDIIQTIGATEVLEDSYSVTYGTMAEFLGPNPTREATIDYTYDFAGWTPALGPVTSDVTYTATYTQKPRMYTIIFQNEGGVEIERQFLTHNEVPVCENVPTKVGHTLEWSPAIAAVTGDATYRAIWHENPPTEYAITFFDYNGTTKLKPTDETPYMVAVGALPTPPADPAGKPASASGEFTYVFDHWAPALEEVSATSAKSYTAVYREEAVTYTVIFLDEDNSEIERHEYAYGETPVCSATPTKPATAAETYTFAWTPQIETVRGAATYKAAFTPVTNRYTVTLKANPSGACTFTGAGTFDYNTTVNNVTVSYDEEQYEFQGWSDLTGDAKMTTTHAAFTLTEDITIVADFRYKGDDKVTITWKNWNGGDLGTSEHKVNAATTYVGATPTREASESTTYTFYGWYTKDNEGDTLNIYKNGMTPKATVPATYYAYFNETPRKYTISWKNEAGTADIEVDYEQPYGATIEYNSATPTKNADADYSYTFDGWSATQGGAVVSLPATVSGDAAFYAHFSKTPVLPTDLILGAGGSTDLASAAVKKNDLVITSNGINSSELKGADNLTLTGEAIFRLEKNFAAQTWYAVAVPWTVALSGIRDKNGNAFAANSLYVLEFDAEVYASANREGGRNDYWHFLHQNGHDMQPGKLYMIWFRSAQTAVQFYKKAGETTIWNTEVSVTTTTGEGAQSNWNAIANPALYHADLSTGATDVLKYNGNDAYIIGSTTNMIVGQPVFVQVETPNYNVTADIAAAPAPYRRALQETTANNRFVVELSLAGKLNDRMIVQTAEEKADTYVIGKDLAKMSVSALNAQMWINRYDAKLCKNTLALQGESVEYPLHISAPQTGGYVLSASQERGDATLYLTYEGEAIWNLSESDYVLQLEKGTTANYGLRISARKTPTGIDEAVVDAQGKIEKVLINDKVFIIRGEKVYTIDGQMVK